MTLPRNEYARALAKHAGKMYARASTRGGVRVGDGTGKRGPWLIDDPDRYVERAIDAEIEAYRWRGAWWCSENAGVRIREGGLTLQALAMHALWLGFVPLTIAAAGLGVLAIMALGRIAL